MAAAWVGRGRVSNRARCTLVPLVLVGLALVGLASTSAADVPSTPAPALASTLAPVTGLPHARGWLGVAMGPVTQGSPQAGAAAPAPTAVKVDHVVRGSPAERAGIHADDQIRRVDGAPVANAREFIRAVGAHSPGESVRLTLVRGKEEQLTIVLADFPAPDAMLRMDHVGSPAPAWVGLEPMSGFPSTIAALHGRVVLIDFWASWCGPCRIVAPILAGWQSRYGSQGLSVVGVTTDSAEDAALYKERTNLRYPIASDPRAETSGIYGVSALPTMFLVDKRGVVREVSVGYNPADDARIEGLIRALLAEPMAPAP